MADKGPRAVVWIEHEDEPYVGDRLEREIAEVRGDYELGDVVRFGSSAKAEAWVRQNPTWPALYVIDLNWADASLNDGMDGVRIMYRLWDIAPAPTILLTGVIHLFADVLERTQQEHGLEAFTVVGKDWHPGELKVAVAHVMNVFKDTRATAVERQAVAYIRRYCDYGENRAHVSLQKLAASKRKDKNTIARDLVALAKAVEATPEYEILMQFLAPVHNAGGRHPD